MLDNFIKEISKELELDSPLTADVPGTYVFPLSEDIKIYISNTPQGISFDGGFNLVSSKQEETFTQLLLANLFGQGTRGAVVGLSEDGKAIKFSKTIEATDYKVFKENLEDFVNLIDFWIDEFKI